MGYTYKYALEFRPDGTSFQSDVIVRNDGTYIPPDPANTDYAHIMALVAQGKLTIAPAS